MASVAEASGLGRESLYKALSPQGNPELSTILRVVKALGLRLHASADFARACVRALEVGGNSIVIDFACKRLTSQILAPCVQR